jgi:hypothetical protein
MKWNKKNMGHTRWLLQYLTSGSVKVDSTPSCNEENKSNVEKKMSDFDRYNYQ